MYFQENRVNSVLPAALHTEVNSVIIIRVIKKYKFFEYGKKGKDKTYGY